MQTERCRACGWPVTTGRSCPRCNGQVVVQTATYPTALYSPAPYPPAALSSAAGAVPAAGNPTPAGRRAGHQDVSLVGPSGLGGYLALPIIGLFGTILWNAVTLISDSLPMFGSAAWESLTTSGSPIYHPLWAPTFVFETFCAIVAALAPIALLILIFQKRRVAPRFVVGFYAFLCVTGLIDAAVGLTVFVGWLDSLGLNGLADSVQSEAAQTLVRVLVLAAIWIPYFLRSQRVKNTFINPPAPGEVNPAIFSGGR